MGYKIMPPFITCAQEKISWDYFAEPLCTDPEHHQWNVEGYVIHNRDLDQETQDVSDES